MNGAESRAKMARMHVGRSWKYDAAHGSRFFFPSRLFAAIGLCFTGQLPGIGTVFILASLQMCKVQGKVH